MRHPVGLIYTGTSRETDEEGRLEAESDTTNRSEDKVRGRLEVEGLEEADERGLGLQVGHLLTEADTGTWGGEERQEARS